MDLQFLVFLFPAGVILCFRELRDEHVFVIIYALVGTYFAGVMVRLMLTLTPCVCVTAAVALSTVLDVYIDPRTPEIAKKEADLVAVTDAAGSEATSKKAKKDKAPVTETTQKPPIEEITTGFQVFSTILKKDKSPRIANLDSRAVVISVAVFLLVFFVQHCTWVTSYAYSSPSVVLASRNQDGSQHIIDDFREAYYWLRQNTKEDAVVMSWWDYGYQIAGMADRPTLVDNNTWNNTHIATVGKAMSSTEEVAYPILRKHDVEYVLIIFGGLMGYSGDDINKFLWMVRIAQGVWPDEIQEPNYFTSTGEYKVDAQASSTMKNCLMYKMSYYKFSNLFGGSTPVDRVRNQQLPTTGPTLDYLEEAFTSENWLVRIYQVKKEDSLGRDLKSANAFLEGKKRKRADRKSVV